MKEKTLVERLSEVEGVDDWTEIEFKYDDVISDCTKGVDRYETVLQEFGYSYKTAPFIYRVHHVVYGMGVRQAPDYWETAHIVRQAILDPSFDMEKYLKRHVIPELSDLKSCVSSDIFSRSSYGRKEMIIPQE